jgi:phosphatidylglycerol lysyltransferase
MSSLYMLRWANYSKFDSWAALRQTMVMFTQFYDPGYQSLSSLQRLFSTTIYTVGALSLGFALIMSLRPVRLRKPTTPTERQHAREVIEAYGSNSMASLALLPDKNYYFSPGGSVIAYTVRGGIAVVMGDPIGPKEDFEASVAGFQAYCQGNDWRPVFCLTARDYLDLYQKLRYRYLCLGHEAVVNLRTFTLAGRASKNYRKRYNHLTELGYRFVFYVPPVPDEVIIELHAISDEWLSIAYGSEKRFFLGWFEEDYIRNTQIAVVRSPTGQIEAFVNVLPEYQLNEITIDLFRHRNGMKSGVMDFLFVSLFLWANNLGYDTFNLGLSALYGVGDKHDDPKLDKAIRKIYTSGNSFYDFKGLQGFKSKFRPFWQPQYLVFPGFTNLPRSLIAMVQANAGSEESFWEYFKPKAKQHPAIHEIDPEEGQPAEI